MSRTSADAAVEFAAETADTGFSEISTTFGKRLAVLGEVDVSGLEHTKVDAQRVTQYANDGTMPIRGTMGGTFKTDFWLPGHGSTTAGAISSEDHEDLLGYVVGNTTSTGTGTTATGSPTTTSIPTAAANGLVAGGIVFVGDLNDAGGGGQAAVVDSHAGSTLALLTALPAAPANGAVIASSEVIHPTETPTSVALRSLRFRALSANLIYAMHGCWPQSLNISGLSPGELPRASVTWGMARWAAVTATFPSAVAVDAFNPAPCAGGSLFIQTVGNTARPNPALLCRAFELNVDLGIRPVMGPGGLDASQHIIGAVRGKQVVTVSFVVDADDATASPVWPGRWDSDSQYYHLLYTANGAATGKRLAIYLPNCCIVDRKPVQMQSDGVNRLRITMRAYTGPTATSELTLSSWRMALG